MEESDDGLGELDDSLLEESLFVEVEAADEEPFESVL